MASVKTEDKIALRVNGSLHQLRVDRSRSLLSVLRDDLNLTGAKRTCDDGECGSCTVLFGKKGVMSCLLPVYRAQSKEITTIEGLAPLFIEDPNALTKENIWALDPLQRAFEEYGATQCGFCIPGMIMQAKGLLNINLNPTREDVTKWLSRNMCRCTGYIKIIDAIIYAAKIIRNNTPVKLENDKSNGNGHIIGSSVSRIDTLSKVVGQAKYAADFKMPGMLYAKILRSPYHHANILSINTSEAEAIPGVEAILINKDIPGRKDTPTGRPQVALFADDKVRFKGEGIAAVAAITEEIAIEAISRIKIDYQQLPSVHDPIEAMQPDSPKLYPPYQNHIMANEVTKGNIKKGFAEADVIVTGTYKTSPWEHAAMEQEAALAYIDEDGRVTVRAALHHFFPGRDWIASMLGLEKDQVRIICQAMGGNFGMRGDFIHVGVSSLLTFKTGKPVKLEYTREESILGSSKSHSYNIKCRSGATKDGRIVAWETELIADGGCFVPIPQVLKAASQIKGMATFVPGPYNIENAHIKLYEVCTNRPRSSPLRGTSMPQLNFAWDSQIDMLANELGMDPLAFRIKNAVVEGSETVTGEILDEAVGAKPTLEALQEHYNQALDNMKSDPPPYPWKRGIGIACTWKGFGGERDKGVKELITEGTTDLGEKDFQSPFGSGEGRLGARASLGWSLGKTGAGLVLENNGRVTALAGAVEKGQGITTIIAQITAESLGIPFEKVDVIVGDTFLAPYPTATNGQRTTFYVGGAIINAALDLTKAIKLAASQLLEESVDNITIKNGMAISSINKAHSVSLEEIAKFFTENNIPTKYDGWMIFEETESAKGPVFSYASQLTIVDVNVETGDVKVPKVVFAADAGNILNPLAFEGQVEGGVMHGLGFALKEQFVPGETVTLKSLNIPLIKDAPNEIVTVSACVPVNGGPFGAKGMGTTLVCPGIPSTLNAISNAIGTRIFEVPAVPSRVLASIEKKKKVGLS
jgi:CO/xanthine dehydrogenase Mo-binding subunit/aerobic-type carbon monoxide dehydrogenase small subunit (CoxS/CutS family)